ncbi:DUF7344 domain-containing protein [Halorussus halobius]|uniref:DUF7344 domain-containing protein n=1 Tax=Halorussus halobius TaxID=1710537 RepID=UPI001092651A|nr:winged helix-turn-helix transcriptional regulator [Halorussus halobius]
MDATPGEDRGSAQQSLDELFDVLSAERRRHALYVLYRRTEPTTVRDLADAVAAECGVDLARVTADLAHVHLPKLADAGLVEYDREGGTVALDDPSDRFDRYLAAAAGDEGEPLGRSSDS